MLFRQIKSQVLQMCCGSFVLLWPCCQAYAMCVDLGIPAFAANVQRVELCVADYCETALLSRECGNIHYSSQDFETDINRWLFRVRYHELGVEDNEYAAFRNGTAIPLHEAQLVSCVPQLNNQACKFIYEALSNAPKHDIRLFTHMSNNYDVKRVLIGVGIYDKLCKF